MPAARPASLPSSGSSTVVSRSHCMVCNSCECRVIAAGSAAFSLSPCRHRPPLRTVLAAGLPCIPCLGNPATMALGDVLFKGTVTLLAGASLIAGVGVATAMVQRFAFHRQVRVWACHGKGLHQQSRANALLNCCRPSVARAVACRLCKLPISPSPRSALLPQHKPTVEEVEAEQQ